MVLWTICSHSKRYENQLPKELMCTFARKISEHRFNLAKWSSARTQRIVNTSEVGKTKRFNECEKGTKFNKNERKQAHTQHNTSKISTEARKSQRNEKSNNKKKNLPI